jgi:predicted AlkP superfamily pyrophosphatase or phosphodiesterase
MYSSVDVSATPRPMYPADGRKIPDVYTAPGDLRDALQRELGQFPLFEFWGPASSIRSSRWIADASRWVDDRYNPTLELIYLPHLDYALQKYGPHDPRVAPELRAIDAVVGTLIDHFQARGARIVVLSEYGIRAVSKPVHLNRRLRERGLIAYREELGREMLDPGASRAFAVADHQVAHVYVNDPSCLHEVRALVEETDGVAEVLDADGKRLAKLDHPRAGELIALAEPDAWFTYYFWNDDARAPDFARTVEIHRKPGYDPVELFVDPAIAQPKLRIGSILLRRKLGFRTLLDVIPLDATLVRGSHGLATTDPAEGPLIITRSGAVLPGQPLPARAVHDVILGEVVG